MSPLDDELRTALSSRASDVELSPEFFSAVERRARGLRRRRVAVALAGSALALAAAALAVPAVLSTTWVAQPAPPATQPTQPESSEAPSSPTTFVSLRNGFSLEHPEGMAVTAARQLWGFTEQVDAGFDILGIDSTAEFRVASTRFPQERCLSNEAGPTPVPCGSTDEQVDDYLSESDGGCGVPRSQQSEITIDGQSGRVAECPNRIEATVLISGRLYLLALSHDRSDARALFDALVATVDLTPETAIEPPGLTATFDSPTYAYSSGYIDRGGLSLATQRWDPVERGRSLGAFDDRFDAVETGLAAYFEAASTPVPDGVSIDAWVDEHITPVAAGGCGVPRSRQAEITIDGQSGRVATCLNSVQATVTAGDRLYLFVLGHERSDAEALFVAWAATIDLTPATASPR